MKLAVLFSVFVLFVACTEHRPSEAEIAAQDEEEATKSGLSADGSKLGNLRVFEGRIPCSDCGGIEQHLSLKGDSAGIYRLREVYKNATEDGDAEIVSNGEWKLIPSPKGITYFLSEKNIEDSVRRMYYSYSGDRITQQHADGSRIDTSGNYTLRLRK